MSAQKSGNNSDLFGDFGGTFPFDQHFINLDQGKMHMVDEGQGEPVILLHGNPTWSYLYRLFIQPLSEKYRVIVPDLLGFGRSEKPVGAPYSLKWHIENITEMIQKLDLKDVTLVLHDWGGPIGLGFAVDHVESIKRLVIMNTWAFSIPADIVLPELLTSVRKPDLGEKYVLEQNIMVERSIPEGIYDKSKVTSQLLEAYRAPFINPASRRSTLALVREIPVGNQGESASIIASIHKRLRLLRVPMVIIWGVEDRVFPVDIVKMWQLYFPSSEVHLIPEASHFLQEDKPEEVVSRILRFLEEY